MLLVLTAERIITMFDFLLRMRIRRRLFLGFGCLLLLMLIVGLGAVARMDQLAERTRASYEQPFDLAERTLQAQQIVDRIRRLNRDVLFEGDPARRTAILQQMERLDGELGQQLQALRDVAPDPRRVDEIVSATTAWRAWREETLRIDEAGDQPAAYRRLLEGSGNPVYDLVVQLDQPFAQEQRLSGVTAWRAE